jgi:hypothetical protein
MIRKRVKSMVIIVTLSQKQRRQALILAQFSMIMPCDPKMNYNQYKSLAKSHDTRVKELQSILTRLKSELSHETDQPMGT